MTQQLLLNLVLEQTEFLFLPVLLLLDNLEVGFQQLLDCQPLKTLVLVGTWHAATVPGMTWHTATVTSHRFLVLACTNM